jgi:acyl-coenzyme A thioesterase 13
MSHTTDIPDGFQLFVRPGNTFMSLCGPVYVKPRDDGQPILGLRVEEKHLNMRGIVHGGMLMTLADSSLGHAINHVRKVPFGLVTVSMTSKFIAAARLGDWIEAHVEVERIGASMAFANSSLMTGGRRLLHASAVFALARPAATKALAGDE